MREFCKVGILTKRARESCTLNPIFPISEGRCLSHQLSLVKIGEGEAVGLACEEMDEEDFTRKS